MHRDIVTAIPKDATIIGSNKMCTAQAMVIPGRLLSVQGHPEFDRKIVEILLDNRVKQGIIPENVYSEAYPRASSDHDGLLVAKSILSFIGI